MLYLNKIFENAEQFREQFGTPDKRKNKLALATMMCPAWREHAHELIKYALKAEVWNPRTTYGVVMNNLEHHGFTDYYKKMKLNGYTLRSTTMATDDYVGVCLDGDIKSVRYVKEVATERGLEKKVYKMRASKLIRKLAEENGLVAKFGDAIINYVAEEFQREWEAYAAKHATKTEYELVVDDDFETIYDSNRMVEGDFHSCMTDTGQWRFYEYAVKAQAASLRNGDGEVVARCIIFTEVYDCDSSECLRLAERQYAANSDQLLMRILVNKLIEAGEIDGYKRIGAGCGDAEAFVSNDGEDWSSRSFYIECNLSEGDTLSYQDSFKYFQPDQGVAFNDYSRTGGCYDSLDITDETYGYSAWDNYHDYSCRETVTVYMNGREYDCDANNLDDFEYVESKNEYHHVDDVVYIDGEYYLYSQCSKCEECGEWYVTDEDWYSTLTNGCYCSEGCRDQAEQIYKNRHWYFSEVTNEYYETEEELLEAEQKVQEYAYAC